jgi:membrane protease YdiL (CAAX protease family)
MNTDRAAAITRTDTAGRACAGRHKENIMKSITAFIKRHPVLTFYALAFAISWGGILIVVGGPGGYPGTPEQVGRLFLFVMLAWFAGPSVASLLMTGLVDGRAGLRDLLSRLLKWRVGARWYALALLTAPLVYVAISFALSLTSPVFLPNILTTSDKAALLLMGLAYGLIGGGFCEELGWTGFAVPRLGQRYGVLTTALIVGVLWGAYHLSVIYWASSPSGALLLVILLAQLFAWMPAFRVLMVWVYGRTQSLLVAMLMHASLSSGMLILTPTALSGVPLLTWLLVLAAVLWIVVAAIAVANHRHLSRQPLPRGMA